MTNNKSLLKNCQNVRFRLLLAGTLTAAVLIAGVPVEAGHNVDEYEYLMATGDPLNYIEGGLQACVGSSEIGNLLKSWTGADDIGGVCNIPVVVGDRYLIRVYDAVGEQIPFWFKCSNQGPSGWQYADEGYVRILAICPAVDVAPELTINLFQPFSNVGGIVEVTHNSL